MTDSTSRSLLRPANQKPTICYCKPGECSAPKPEWCVGRRYADGFREAGAEPVAWRVKDFADGWALCSQQVAKQAVENGHFVQPLYTAPLRPDYELSAIAAAIGSSRFMDPPDGGDVSLAEQVCRMREALERAEATLAQSDAEPVAIGELEALINSEDNEKCVILPNGQVIRESHPEWKDFAPQSDAEPVAWPTDEQVEIACEAFNAKCKETRVQGFKPCADLMKAALQAAVPPHPDASAGLIEAAEIAEEQASRTTGGAQYAALESLAAALRARAADRSGK